MYITDRVLLLKKHVRLRRACFFCATSTAACKVKNSWPGYIVVRRLCGFGSLIFVFYVLPLFVEENSFGFVMNFSIVNIRNIIDEQSWPSDNPSEQQSR